MKLTSLEKIPLRKTASINESMIQQYIFDNPSAIGLGNLIPIQRERTQPTGGRLDLILVDDNNTRYEMEIQLGATDPSHIIRTIEYWDTEKKRYPQYDHCAVIIAEEITGRFLNVISLFNGSIPLVAIQMSAYRMGDDVAIIFTKILDRIEPGEDEEAEASATDRAYWESKSTPGILKMMDSIFSDITSGMSGFELKYNKFYVGASKNGIAKNFVFFKGMKNHLQVFFKGDESSTRISALDESGLDLSFSPSRKEYRLRINNSEEYHKHKDAIIAASKDAMDFFNIQCE